MGVLLDGPAEAGPITRLVAPQDVWDEIPEATTAAVMPKVEALGLPVDREPLFAAGGELETARVAYATLQAWEAWQEHRMWIEAERPEFGAGVAARFANAATIRSTDLAAAQRVRSGIVALVRDRLPEGTALAIPAAPGPAFVIGDSPNREAIVRLTCIAGLAGAPGLAVPAGTVDGLPVGLQLVAAPGGDERLLELA
jgi:amidase